MKKERKMKVLLVNTSETIGGAAIAAKRLLKALNRYGVEATLLVRDKGSELDKVVTINARWKYIFSFYWERFIIWLASGLKRTKLFQIDLANAGVDITRQKEFQDADVIHLHWINQGMLSLHQIGRILTSGKPVVWTLHDMWPITGICHHARVCDQYQSYCMTCPYMGYRKKTRDISYRVFQQKKALYIPCSLCFVGCSQWIAEEARKSNLTKNQIVESIPNPISTVAYYPQDKIESRKKLALPLDKKLILFGAVNALDKRKGFEPFIQACQQLKKGGCSADGLAVIVLGMNTKRIEVISPYPVYSMGYVDSVEQMVNIYNAVDLYVTSSLEENLPNMLMEAMACGTPCVGFNVGGVAEMIDHLENGYVAAYGDVSDLVNGIQWVLTQNEKLSLSQKARVKVMNSYSEEVVTPMYIELYKRLLDK